MIPREGALVVGATGGIGGALAEAAERAGFAPVLRLGRSAGAIRIDITDARSIANAAEAVARSLDGRALRLSVCATGVLHEAGMMPERSLRALRADAFARAFAVNATGPAMVLAALAPLFPKQGRSVFAALSARVGSIGDNRLGGWMSYRASKAALNQVVRTAAIELARTHPEHICVALHPGTVATALSRPFRAADAADVFPPGDAAARLLAVLDAIDPTRSGACLDHGGTVVPP